ncbi:response regulator [Shewanella sp. 1_MG-2023]|uniref:Response regulator n=1 Tax=Shewanella electrodiphila TaxID=934143 RepID=A0ABT0KUH8_9GAMM|nr:MULTISPECIES: response regulator [Shewanella]MCC4834344.1 response regulator [Shewanella sp. 10N.7]MCL1047505.1 response regulator [Shewanella electrodiphila]MDO6612677.1 response regulator [Shewanella sp. 7_MG-2023]MDO6772376.1 response regulator [Shewanella sp. 2_MG-2023]MDO6796574.1 response regulator [Shewanella sp. 1_MG-2023]
MLNDINGPVYLVDDDEAIIDSITFLMEGYGYKLISFNSGDLFLSSVDLATAGCVILDARMPGLSGPEVQQLLTEANSPLAVIFLTGHGDVPMAVDAFKQGAFDFFQKPVQGKVLSNSIEKGLLYSIRQHWKMHHLALIDGLSEREKQIFKLVIAGNTNKQMSNELCVAVRTIEVHRSKLMDKLGVQNIAELMKLAPLV